MIGFIYPISTNFEIFKNFANEKNVETSRYGANEIVI